MRKLAYIALALLLSGCVDPALATPRPIAKRGRSNAQTIGGFTDGFSYQFDGGASGASHCDTPTPFAAGETTATVAVVWQLDAATTGNDYLWLSGTSDNFGLRINGTTLDVMANAGGNANYKRFLSALPAVDTWTYTVVVYDGSQGTSANRIAVYQKEGAGAWATLSGTESGTIPATIEPGPTTTDLAFGSRDGGGNGGPVTISEWAWWDSVSTFAQAQELESGGAVTDWAATTLVTRKQWKRFGDTGGDTTTVLKDWDPAVVSGTCSNTPTILAAAPP